MADDKRIHELDELTTPQSTDLLLIEQSSSNVDKKVKLSNIVSNETIVNTVENWLDEHVDPETGYVIDDTLTVSQAASDSKTVGDYIFNLIKYNAFDIIEKYSGSNGTYNGVTYSFSGNTCTTTGSTDTSISFRNIFGSLNSLPDFVKAGDYLYCKVNTTNTNVRLAIFCYDSSQNQILPNRYLTSNQIVQIPSNTVGLAIRIDVPKNIADASSTISYEILNHMGADTLTMRGALPNNTDADTVSDTGAYLINSGSTYTNLPVTTGFLLSYATSYNTVLQVVYGWSSSAVYKRNCVNSTWSDWELVGDNVINNYTFEEYSNTYNISSSPSITTDTNAYLAPSGDTTDRTADIVTMLTSLGVCRLGKGDYYVSNLEMPTKTQIIGAGHGTRIILAGSSAGYAIKMSNYCNVSDCQIVGSTSSIVLSSTVGDRHGILWQGNYTQDPTPSNQPINGMIDNVRFSGFTGGAITCYDTGYGTFNGLEVSNIFVLNCCVGINISYLSEFNKFTNVRTASCYYGCINNGGNNVFINCDFSTCKLGFLMDNSQSQSPNNSHGSCIGCVFNHTDSNTGIGISILNCANAFIFEGCQIFFSQINIEDSDGIVFSGCNFGSTNCDITIDGGGAILFLGNMHQTDPTKTITNNNHVIFANCYVRNTGAAVTNS